MKYHPHAYFFDQLRANESDDERQEREDLAGDDARKREIEDFAPEPNQRKDANENLF